MEAESAYREALVGEFAAAERLLASGALDPAWKLALQAVYWLAAPDLGRPPRVEDVLAVGSSAAAVACEQMELAARLAFDARAHAEWLHAHEAVVARDEGAAGSGLRAARAWQAWLQGAGWTADALAELGREAARIGVAEVAIDATVLAALGALDRGDLEAATTAARRASRMARTESLLQREYLANIVLARVRRHAGLPHRALRILAQLARVTPAPWHRWLAWEELLAGHVPTTGEGGTLVAAARRGDRRAFHAAAESLIASLAGLEPFRREALAWIAALDPASDPDPAAIADWAYGRTHASPCGVSDPEDAAGTLAYVVAQPGRRGRRLLRAGLALAGRAVDLGAIEKDKREAAAIAALGLAGPEGLDPADLFAQVYGFAFTTEKHDSVLRTLLHRTREVLGTNGSVGRAPSGHLQLRVARTIVVPDPRCARPAEQRVLALLAAGGAPRSARDLAAELRVPLRTVQLALQGLVDDGEVEAEKHGRAVEYRVEDTTFHQPSITRLRRAPHKPSE